MPENKGQLPKIAPEFRSMGDFNAEINDIGYARYNYQELLNREAKITKMIEGASDTALFNSGAAAMHSTLEAEGLKTGDVVFCANAIYGTSKADIKQLGNLGIKVVFFDSTDMESLGKLVKRETPRLIVAESIANSKNMEVTDLKSLGQLAQETNNYYQELLKPAKILENFLSKREDLKSLSLETQSSILSSIEEYQQGHNPFVFRNPIRKMESETGMQRPEVIRELSRIVRRVAGDSREKLSLVIDNTLPSPQLINPLKTLKEFGVETIIIESGTKHYQEGANEITLGLAYSDNAGKIEAIKARRIELGTYLQPTDEQKIPKNIEQTMPEIMKNHARNALQLAQALSEFSEFEVSHPNLPEHKQSELVNSLAPQGAVTLFYITVPERLTGEQFMQKVKDIAGEQVGLGSSFGHHKTWLSNYGMDNRTIRIAAGSEIEENFRQIIDIFRKIAAELAIH